MPLFNETASEHQLFISYLPPVAFVLIRFMVVDPGSHDLISLVTCFILVWGMVAPVILGHPKPPIIHIMESP